ncbi:MAG: hypothetical protein QHC90_28885 [Shinella sp.]|nr:hypothetical protein [Shinella sp.]
MAGDLQRHHGHGLCSFVPKGQEAHPAAGVGEAGRPAPRPFLLNVAIISKKCALYNIGILLHLDRGRPASIEIGACDGFAVDFT